MTPRQFADEAEIVVQAGKGGPGSVSFLRQRYKPRGAPDGGNGGAGGDIILEVRPSTRTLRAFRHRRRFTAPAGQSGRGQNQHGRGGDDLIIPIPPGTLVYDAVSGHLLVDLTRPGERWVAARGGRGGKGNAHFTSSRMRSPRFSQPGEPGQERRLRLELAVLADAGFVGLPNAGKTTLLTRLTASRAQPGAYPFSTLEPNLGVLVDEDHDPLILADIPGLIPGAHLGKGLGQQFLRHVRRTRVLLHVVDSTQVDPEDPLAALRPLEAELAAFDPKVLAKPRHIVLNKIDLLPPDFPLAAMVERCRRAGMPCLAVSGATGAGLAELTDALRQAVAQATPETEEQAEFLETADYHPGETGRH